MKWSDLKYLAAYSLPISFLLGVSLKGIFFWFTPVLAFVLVPILEILLPVDPGNTGESAIPKRAGALFFDLLLYLNVIMVFAVLGYALWLLTWHPLSAFEKLGVLFSCGIVMGANGINVAHELGHRRDGFSRMLAKFLLLPSLYSHFYIEHNFGHHLHAATREDPATARFNQSIYSFWGTSVIGQYTNAWRIQLRLLQQRKHGFLSGYNDMFWSLIFQVSYLVFVALVFNITTAGYAVIMAVISFLLLETINYIEHYGLLRSKLPSGRYERVRTVHSWNSDHIMGRIMLYELTRHSDHHYRASKKYQLLDHHEESPQMPYGYPTSMVLAMLPPLWFYIMNARIPGNMKKLAA